MRRHRQPVCLPARPLVLHYDVRLHLPDRTCSLLGVHIRRRLQLPVGRELHVRQLAVVVHRHQRLPRGREHAHDRAGLQWLDWPGVRLSELESRFPHGVCLLGQRRRQHGFDLDLHAVRPAAPRRSRPTTCARRGTGLAICSYGSTRCTCAMMSGPWVCGLGVLWHPPRLNPDTNTANCGATGRGCSTENVAALWCQGGVCASSCQTGWLNVSQPASGPDDGCETVDLDTNTAHCGATGRSCSTQNVAVSSCRGGVCTSTCQTGWLNVSQPASGPDDGCETIDTAVNVVLRWSGFRRARKLL